MRTDEEPKPYVKGVDEAGNAIAYVQLPSKEQVEQFQATQPFTPTQYEPPREVDRTVPALQGGTVDIMKPRVVGTDPVFDFGPDPKKGMVMEVPTYGASTERSPIMPQNSGKLYAPDGTLVPRDLGEYGGRPGQSMREAKQRRWELMHQDQADSKGGTTRTRFPDSASSRIGEVRRSFSDGAGPVPVRSESHVTFSMKDALDAVFGGLADGSLRSVDPDDVHELVDLIASDPSRTGRSLGLKGSPTSEGVRDALLSAYYDSAVKDPSFWDMSESVEAQTVRRRYESVASRTGVPIDEVARMVDAANDGDTAAFDSLMANYYSN